MIELPTATAKILVTRVLWKIGEVMLSDGQKNRLILNFWFEPAGLKEAADTKQRDTMVLSQSPGGI